MAQVRFVDVSHGTLFTAFKLARAVSGREDDEPDLTCACSLPSEDVCPSQQEHGEAFGRNVTEQVRPVTATLPSPDTRTPHRNHQSSIKGDKPCLDQQL